MSQDNEATKRFELFKTLRAARDSLLADVAGVTLAFTRTELYQRANAAIAKPGFLVSALLKEKREAVMAAFLSQLNMPSREDVLTLSQRMTRIEMVLDDVGAGIDQLRRTAARPQRAPVREATNGIAPVKGA